MLQGVLGQALPQLRQLFERLPAASATADADARFEHFCSHVWPQIKEASAKGRCKPHVPGAVAKLRSCEWMFTCLLTVLCCQ